MYKEGYTRPSSVDLESLYITKPGMNVTLETTRTLGEKPNCVQTCPLRVNFICCGHAPTVDFDIHAGHAGHLDVIVSNYV